MEIVRTEGLVSGYGKMQIVNGVDLAIESGEIVTIIGPNGAGKSTYLKSIVGVVPPWEGKVIYKGTDITGLSPNTITDYGIAFVPQIRNVFPTLTTWENLKMGAWNRPDGFEERLDDVAEVFPIVRERRDQRVGTMSGGQQKMVALASAMMTDPELLILDEPSAGLAPAIVDDVFESISTINATGTAILMVEQNARRALRESDRGVVLAMGRKVEEGTNEDLLDSETVAELYLGG